MLALHQVFESSSLLKETNFKLKRGADNLFERLEREQISHMIDIDRKNVCRKRFGSF